MGSGDSQARRFWIGNYSWFLGCSLGFGLCTLLERRRPMFIYPKHDSQHGDGDPRATGGASRTANSKGWTAV